MSIAGPAVINGEEQTNATALMQRDALLRTKLFVPPARSNAVSRPRLIELIQGGLDKTLILVSAPAGYGKTTLVSGWLHETGLSSAWFSLDEGDNDPVRFLQYLLAALQGVFPALQFDVLSILQGTQPTAYDGLANILINEIAGHETPFVLVLDDFQVLQSQAIMQMLTYLLEHMPPQMHLALLTRSDPPLPLARLRACNQLLDIRANQLRFTQEEVAIFLNDVMQLELSADDIMRMEKRAEGWIAGLQLAALSIQSCNDVHGFVSAFAGSQAYIMDYLAEEVLRLQPEGVRVFLLKTSILGRLCGPLCNAVLGMGETEDIDGQMMLETLEKKNLFLVPLDDKRHWYRYHQLFADVLNRRLESQFPDQLRDLHLRAAQWLAQNGSSDEAIQHTLMAGDRDLAAQLVDQYGCLLLMRGEVVNLLGWIEAVEAHARIYPWVAIQKGWALALAGRLDRVEGALQTAERLITAREYDEGSATMCGAIAAARAFCANMNGEAKLAADFARQALGFLPVSDDFSCSLRSAAISILGDASWMSGDLGEARDAYQEAVRISRAAGNIDMILITTSNHADIMMELGLLQQSAGAYSEALKLATLPDGQVSPLVERIYAGLSLANYEWNRLESAEEHAQQCIEHSLRWGGNAYQAIGFVILAKLAHIQPDPKKALEMIRAAEHSVRKYPLSPWRSTWFESTLARLWVAQGNLEKAAELIRTNGITTDRISNPGEISTQQEPVVLAQMHLLLAQGDHDALLALSSRLLEVSETTKRVGRVIEVLILRALAFQGKKDIERSLADLERALALAQPEGYVRVFLDEGEPMVRLLYQAKTHRMGGGYAAELVAQARRPEPEMPATQLLIEPLTLRELEVLRLIAAGFANQEIAAKLVISIPTVKRHISNIYTKLGAKNRTQAVSLARELSLLE
jgi:LuxR family maltose regulon positive regulatory protein